MIHVKFEPSKTRKIRIRAEIFEPRKMVICISAV